MSVLTCLHHTRPLGETEKGGEQQDEAHLQSHASVQSFGGWPSVSGPTNPNPSQILLCRFFFEQSAESSLASCFSSLFFPSIFLIIQAVSVCFYKRDLSSPSLHC